MVTCSIIVPELEQYVDFWAKVENGVYLEGSDEIECREVGKINIEYNDLTVDEYKIAAEYLENNYDEIKLKLLGKL